MNKIKSAISIAIVSAVSASLPAQAALPTELTTGLSDLATDAGTFTTALVAFAVAMMLGFTVYRMIPKRGA